MKSKLLFFISTFSCLLINSSSQAQIFQWAQSAVGQNSFDNVRAYSTCTDASGYVYVTGSFGESFTVFGNDTVTSAGLEDMFLVKFDQNGNVLWAKSAGGNDDYEFGRYVTTDNFGNVYVTGNFSSASVIFGSTTLTNSGSSGDMFFVKYDSNGNVLWAKSAGGGGNNDDNGLCIAVDANNYTYVTGYFRSPTITFGSTTLTNAGPNTDVFLVKYDQNGNALWAKSAQGYNNDMGYEVAADGNNNIYITGYFRSPSIIFDNDTLLNPDATNYEMFVAKYNSNGYLLWAKSAGDTGDDAGSGISTDNNGNVYVTGYFESSITFGGTVLTSIGSDDIFLVKYDSTGNILLAKSAGGASNDYGTKAVADINGDIYLVGAFSNSPIIFGSTTLTNSGGYDIFITKYDPYGNVLWAKGAGGNGGDNCSDVAIDDCKNIYLAGSSSGSYITFDNITVAGGLGGGSMAYVAKLGYVPDVPICLVTVDSLSENNIIVWSKPIGVPIDSIIVYRDTANNNFARIGAVPNDSTTLSQFIDTVRSLYLANGNPKASSWRYKIATKETCGDISVLSPYHQTIFIQNNGANFNWSEYKIEGQPTPVPGLNNYIFQRDNFSTGTFNNIISLSASSTLFTDTAFSNYPNASYRVMTQWTTQCTATKVSVDYNSSRSNVKAIAPPVSVKEISLENVISIYPNPNDGTFTISILNDELRMKNFEVKIYNVLGEIVLQKPLTTYSAPIILKQPAGIYNIQLITEKEAVNKKLILY